MYRNAEILTEFTLLASGTFKASFNVPVRIGLYSAFLVHCGAGGIRTLVQRSRPANPLHAYLLIRFSRYYLARSSPTIPLFAD